MYTKQRPRWAHWTWIGDCGVGGAGDGLCSCCLDPDTPANRRTGRMAPSGFSLLLLSYNNFSFIYVCFLYIIIRGLFDYIIACVGK